MPQSSCKMRSFISPVAFLVKVTARMWRWAGASVLSRRAMYSAVRVNVLPDPAEALYTVSAGRGVKLSSDAISS